MCSFCPVTQLSNTVLPAKLYVVEVWNKEVKEDDKNGTDRKREELLRI